MPRKLSAAILLPGTLLVLVKPHFGLLPTLMLLYRAVVQKRLFSIMRDPDFLALACGVLAYLAVIGIFFGDYWQKILPDVLALYLPAREPGMAQKMIFNACMIGMFAYLYFFLPAEKRQKNFTLFLFAAALAALVPYFVQGKNYWYHLVPALVLFFCALTAMAQTILASAQPRLPAWARTVQPYALLAGMIAAAYAFMPLNTQFPTHAELRALPLTQRVAQCPQPCTFFMFNDNIGIIHPTAIYTGHAHASRFPSVWFLPPLINYDPQSSLEGYADRKYRYADMLAEDLARYKPKLMFIGRFVLEKGTSRTFRLGAFFSDSDNFYREWEKYKKTDSITVTNADYYRGTALESDKPIVFDIYERLPDADTAK